MELLINSFDAILTVNDGLQWFLEIAHGVQRRGVLLGWLTRSDTASMAKVDKIAGPR